MEDHQSQPDRDRSRLVENGVLLAWMLATVPLLLMNAVGVVFWIASFLVGVFVLRTIRRDHLPRKGYVAAWMVVVFSSLALLLIGLIISPLFGPRHSIHRGYCSNNLHQLGLAMDSYAHKHQDRYPDPDNWPQQIMGYVKSQSIFICPARKVHGLRRHPIKAPYMEALSVTYAMNERLKGLSVRDVKKPEKTVLLFESTGEKLSGGPELLPKETRHEDREYLVIRHPYINVLFADGHVNKVPLEEVPRLKWDPK